MSEIADAAYGRLALVVSRFRDCAPDDVIAAISVRTGTGTARLTYGDLRDLARQLGTARATLARIAFWHTRETGPHGMVGDYCTECGATWPCETRRMADGSHEDLVAEVTDAAG